MLPSLHTNNGSFFGVKAYEYRYVGLTLLTQITGGKDGLMRGCKGPHISLFCAVSVYLPSKAWDDNDLNYTGN